MLWLAVALLLVPVAAAALDNVRFPFTAGGFRYDLNHKKWHGLDSGNSFGF